MSYKGGDGGARTLHQWRRSMHKCPLYFLWGGDQSSPAKGQNECSWIITQQSSLTSPLRLTFFSPHFFRVSEGSRGTSSTLLSLFSCPPSTSLRSRDRLSELAEYATHIGSHGTRKKRNVTLSLFPSFPEVPHFLFVNSSFPLFSLFLWLVFLDARNPGTQGFTKNPRLQLWEASTVIKIGGGVGGGW